MMHTFLHSLIILLLIATGMLRAMSALSVFKKTRQKSERLDISSEVLLLLSIIMLFVDVFIHFVYRF